jgi:hypothetical protein
LSELADYRKINGHCNVAKSCSKNTKLANWIASQRAQYKGAILEDRVVDHRASHEGIASAAASHPMNVDSEQASENDVSANEHVEKQATLKSPSNVSGQRGRVAWEVSLTELADYCKIHGHCNVPRTSKLGAWVANQRHQYRMHLEGKRSQINLARCQELESLGFEWDILGSKWEDRLIELARFRKIHGHCNVTHNYSKELGNWVGTQRYNYRLHLQGKKSNISLYRIQELESLGFEW